MSFDIVPAHLAVKAMRDNGYKNAAYALAELMDNAIQAGATSVELLCGERVNFVESRSRSQLDQLAVLDNGKGMSAEVLQMALQFGNGTHLDEDSPTGMGKFGMGLPASSISQAQRVEVWTWQGGISKAIYSYLDVEEIRKQTLTSVPVPKKKEIPSVWKTVASSIGNNGTLVVWSRIDRCLWKTAKAVIDNSELLVGRMYRKFLAEGKVTIRLASFDLERPENGVTYAVAATPNDPGYLMVPSSTPTPFDSKAMFDRWGGELYEHVETIKFRGQEHPVKIRFSFAKPEARASQSPGAQPYGKHAGKNIGVSIIRADRELDLDQSLVIQYDPTERWWGVEVDFPPYLDELFGVTNNKQQARNFAEAATVDIRELAEGETATQILEQADKDQDPRAALFSITNLIDKRLSTIRELLKQQTVNQRSKKRHDVSGGVTPEQEATEKTKDRQEEGHKGSSDAGEALPPQQKQEEIEDALSNQGVESEVAQSLAAQAVRNSLKYVFVEAPSESPAFFSVQPRGGAIIITLNTTHPAYGRLVDVLEKDSNAQTDVAELTERLNRALDGLKLLLMAWARYEDEQPDGALRQRTQDTRLDWGRIARGFLQEP
ncbi:MAG: ATP-binding protein [Acidobacteriota bacterium]|nr:ATP-binding protein [Acidobacteriota bacterium]